MNHGCCYLLTDLISPHSSRQTRVLGHPSPVGGGQFAHAGAPTRCLHTAHHLLLRPCAAAHAQHFGSVPALPCTPATRAFAPLRLSRVHYRAMHYWRYTTTTLRCREIDVTAHPASTKHLATHRLHRSAARSALARRRLHRMATAAPAFLATTKRVALLTGMPRVKLAGRCLAGRLALRKEGRRQGVGCNDISGARLTHLASRFLQSSSGDMVAGVAYLPPSVTLLVTPPTVTITAPSVPHYLPHHYLLCHLPAYNTALPLLRHIGNSGIVCLYLSLPSLPRAPIACACHTFAYHPTYHHSTTSTSRISAPHVINLRFAWYKRRVNFWPIPQHLLARRDISDHSCCRLLLTTPLPTLPTAYTCLLPDQRSTGWRWTPRVSARGTAAPTATAAAADIHRGAYDDVSGRRGTY